MQRRGDRERFGEELRWIELLEPRERPQVALAVGVQRETRAVDRGVQTGRGERVLQRAPAAHVHVHVARRDERQAELAAELREHREPAAILPGGQELDRDPQPLREQAGEPARVGDVGRGTGQPEREAVAQVDGARDAAFPRKRRQSRRGVSAETSARARSARTSR